jgi:hypothetical protein
MRIEVLRHVPESLARVTDRVGSTQVSVASRLLEWFSDQPDVVQAAILGLHSDDVLKDLPKKIIEGLRDEKL